MSSFVAQNTFAVTSLTTISAGDAVRKTREAAGYSIEQLSIASGLTAAEIQAIESGEDKEPSRLGRIASALQVPLSTLVG